MFDDLIAWMILGAAASLAAMILPFRRGAQGVVASLASGVLGGTVGGFLGWRLLPGTLHERSVASLLCAAGGAVLVIVCVRALYAAWTSSRRPKGAADAWRS